MKIGDSFYQLSPNLSKNEDNINVNSFFYHFYKDYSNKFNLFLKQIIGSNGKEDIKYDFSNAKVQKTLAFKENIFVHNKKLSLALNENNKDYDDMITNPKRKKYFFNSSEKKNKNEINYLRPKSSIIKYKSKIKNSSTKSKIVLDKYFLDISCIKNSKTKIQNFSYSKNKKKQKIIEKPSNAAKSMCMSTSHNFNNDIDEIKAEIKNKIMNLKFEKNKKPQMFMKRPMPSLNEKCLLCLPKDIKKETKNKYNIFNYILTDDIYNNSINLIRRKKSNKNKNNLLVYKNSNIKNNLFNNSILKSRVEKKSKIMNYTDTKANSNNKIYKPVKLKINELFSLTNSKIRKINEEEGDFYQKIKSNPFINKRK